MPKIRTGGSAKWVNRASSATNEYSEGVKNPRNDWAEATKNAEATYQSGIQQAIAEKRFAKGVTKAGSEKWRQKAIEVGPSRFSQGVQVSEDAYASGIQPFLDTIQRTTLPPRGPKGDPRNLERVKIMADALRKRKQAM